MRNRPDLDDPADRRRLMLAAADHAGGSSAPHLRSWCAHKFIEGRLPIPEDQDQGIMEGLWNHARAWARDLYDAPVFFSTDRRPWTDDEPAWVINLRDGWQNLRTGIEHGATSYTLITLRKPFISVVAPVFSHRWYMAAAGLGAWQQDGRGGEPRQIHTSPMKTLDSSTLTFGLPAGDDSAAVFRPATKMRPKAGTLRLSGCSSLDLVDVARGATQSHFEAGVNPADVAGGLLILREGGGIVTDWKGQDLYPGTATDPINLAASNGWVHAEMLDVLGKLKMAPA